MEHDKDKSKLPPRIVRYQKMLINVKGPMVIFDKQKPQPQTFDLTKLESRAGLHKFLMGAHTFGELADLTIGLMDLVRIQEAKITALTAE